MGNPEQGPKGMDDKPPVETMGDSQIEAELIDTGLKLPFAWENYGRGAKVDYLNAVRRGKIIPDEEKAPDQK